MRISLGVFLAAVASIAALFTSNHVSAQTNCAPVPAGLVGWWAGEGNAADSTGANNGLLEGGVTFLAGEVGQAFSLNGTDADVRVPASPALNVGTGGGMTIEVWIKPADVVASQPIVEWNDGRFGVLLDIAVPVSVGGAGAGSFCGYFKDINLAGHAVNSPPGALNANSFQHVAVTYDKTSGMAVAYLNGAVVGQANLGNFTPMTLGDVYLGVRPYDSGAGVRFAGQMDEVSIYSRALSAAEIQAIAAAGSSGKCAVAPVIAIQPQSQTVLVGTTVTLSVTASGSPPLSYQWQLNSTNLPGATGSSLVLTHVQLGDAGAYAVVVSNSAGTATSANAVLTVNPPPPCAPTPSGLVGWWAGEGNANDSTGANNGLLEGGMTFVTGEVGQAFNFNGDDADVRVTANPSLDVGLGAGFTIEAWIKPADLSALRPIVEWNSVTGFVPYGVHFWTSQPSPWGGTGPGCLYANLVDTAGVSHPFSSAGNLLTTSAFQHVALTYVKATGLAVIYLNGSAVAQANLGSFTPQTSSDLYLGYRPSSLAIVYRWVGQMDEVSLYNRALSTAEIQAIYSASVSGKCSLAPVIVSQPQDQAVVLGTTATFSVTASGTPPLTYQWQLNSNNIPGATGSSLVLTHVQLGDAGAYAVVVSNSAGTATSANAVLTVNLPPPCVAAPSGLVGWWRGQGNTLDDAGGNTGLSKGGLSFAEAEVGQGFVFNGTDAYVKVPANSSLNVGLGAGFTIEAWINPADLSLPRPLVEWNSGAGFAPYGVHFWISQPLPYGNGPGCLFANLIDTTGGTHWFPSAAGLLTSNAWQHVALTYVKASGLAVFYLNGSAVAQQDLGTLAPQTATDFYLGARVAGPGSALYVGQMDEVSLYNRALSASQIQAIYNAGSSGKCPLPPTLLAQPQGAIVPVGGTVSFTALARGTPPLSYQWQLDSDNLKDGGNLFGATSSTLVISNATPANSGTYTLVATNPAGSALSTGAVLTVIDPSGAGKPTVRIVSPANNAYLATAATMVKGTAKGPLGLAQVYYQLNGAGWQLATTTNAWSAWTAPVTVSFGTNLFQVFSVNMVGTPSATNNARFVLGLFAEVAGTYNGLFYDTNGVTPASAGFFTITVTPKGKYTGSLRLAGARYPLSGQFDSDGVSYVSILRQDLSVVSLQLLIDLTQGTDRLTGLVTAGLWAAELAADRAVFDGRTSLAPQAGRYTLIIPGTNSTAGPTGDSYGTLTVDGAGNIRLTASLADGTPLSQAVPVSKNGQWPLYAPLYSGQGLILGWLSFPPGPKDDFKGDVIWIKPTTSKARYYPAGFLIQTTASGSVYSPPGRGTNVLGETSLTLALTGGNLAEGITNQFTLNVNNRVTNHSSNRLSLTFLPSTGSFKGSVVDPVGLKSIPFNGVVLQNRGVGAGYFLGSNRGGQVFIAP